MGSRKHTAQWAKYKNKRRLKRQGLFYIPDETYALLSVGRSPENRRQIIGPLDFRIVENSGEVIAYFQMINHLIDNGVFINADLSNVEKTDLASIAILISMMMDGRSTRIKKGHLQVTIPNRDNQPGRLFKQAQFHETVTKGNATNTYFLSRQGADVNQPYIEDVLAHTRIFIGSDRYDRTMSPILVEITANTKNHATPSDAPDDFRIPWFLAVSEDIENGKMYFSVVDLGVGIYESLKEKGIANSASVRFEDAIRDMYENSQNKFLAQNIPQGVDSSTGLFYRGQGLQTIYNNAQSSDYGKFVIITNKAKVNMKNIDTYKADASESFAGTVYYWEISK